MICDYKIKNFTNSLYSLPLQVYNQDVLSFKRYLQNNDHVMNLIFFHTCTFIFEKIVSNVDNEIFSVLTLKQFLTKFVLSNEIQYTHLALKILIKFGLEVFSSIEEELFLDHLVRLATLPSLAVGHRLLSLSFIKIVFSNIFKAPLASPPLSLLNMLYPLHFDGPDTQEKKLAILNDSSYAINDEEYFNLLTNLHKQSSSEYYNYERFTNSLFRILNNSLHKRPQLIDRNLKLLLECIFSISYCHYLQKIDKVFFEHWELAQMLVDKFIAKLMMMKKDQESTDTDYPLIFNYSQYVAFLKFINWFLSIAHHNIQLTEFQLDFLIRFIHKNCLELPQTCTLGLSCCTSILYYQQVTNKVKEALIILLDWLKNERKSDLETSSLAHIYLLALLTLQEYNIKQVFTSDEEEFLFQKSQEIYCQYVPNIMNISLHDCPVKITKLSSNYEVNRKNFDDSIYRTVDFNIYLESSKFDRLFCLEIRFNSTQIDKLEQTFQIPLIERNQTHKISLVLDFQINDIFQLNISIKFIDFKGFIYNYPCAKTEMILLEDIFIPLDLTYDIVQFKNLNQNILKHSESIQTLICIDRHPNLESFFQHHSWMTNFIIHVDQTDGEQLYFAIGLSPDRIITGEISVINQSINLKITTNNFEIIPLLCCKFETK